MVTVKTEETVRTNSRIEYINPQVPHIERPIYLGKRYETRVPDTLDLHERAALAVKGLTGPTDPEADYELYWSATFAHNPPFMYHDFNDHVQTKFNEALPLMRLISGCDLNEQVDQRWMEVVLQMQGPDGLLYYPLVGRPWAGRGCFTEQTGPLSGGDHYCEPYANGRLLGAISIYYWVTGDKRWMAMGQRVVDGLIRKVVNRGEYAYFSKGVYDIGEMSDPKASMPSPWMNMTFGWVIMGLAQFYRITGYEPALVLAGQVTRYIQFHGNIFDADGRFVDLDMHCHGHLYPLLGMLEYATLAHDEKVIQFVQKGFTFGRANMWPVMGYVSEAIDDQGFQTGEICGVADMIALALKLTKAGVADYWDDVDRWTRNHFAEGQLTNIDWVYEMLADKSFSSCGGDIGDIHPPAYEVYRMIVENTASRFDKHYTVHSVPERCLGGFAGWPSANDWQGRDNHTALRGLSIQQCCTGNGARSLYYVWENTVAYESDSLKVNLLLNHASPWVDMNSYIPYQGQVDLKLKIGCDLSIRIPEWVAPDQVQCRINDSDCSLSWAGRYLLVGNVKPEDSVTLTFPIWTRTDMAHIHGRDYRLTRKGNEIVHIDPPGDNCPLYQRDHYRANTALWRHVQRFVSDKRIDW